jgi:hypothetical protein
MNNKRGVCNYEFDFSEKEWADIKAIAIEILDSRQFGTDQLKCAIAAFLVYTNYENEPEQPKNIDLGAYDPNRVLH